jgi:hypothetical protein
MIKDQFDTLYREGAENGRVMCLSLHPHNIGRPNAARHLDEALRYILGHDGVWATTADDIAEHYLANNYDQVKSWIAERKSTVRDTAVARVVRLLSAPLVPGMRIAGHVDAQRVDGCPDR